MLLGAGGLLVIISLIFDTLTLSFIGLTLLFWSVMFLYSTPGNIINKEFTTSIINSYYGQISDLIEKNNIRGTPIYIPFTKEFSLAYNIGYENEFIYLPKERVSEEAAVAEAFNKNPSGLRISAPGFNTLNMIEKRLPYSLRNLDKDTLDAFIETTLIKDLGLVSDVNMDYEEDIIKVTIRNNVIQEISTIYNFDNSLHNIGCPINSVIACILLRVLKKPVLIQGYTQQGNNSETIFKLL